MATILVSALDEVRYRVTVEEGRGRTVHEVTVTPADRERYAPDVDVVQLLNASFEFLLEREPKESILARFELPVIERYFPDYPRRIRERLSSAGL